MTTNQILVGTGLILVLAVGSQVLASRLRIPALIVLLPVGFVAGALTTGVNPERLLGAAFEPLVSLSVAVILYDAGLGLDLRKLKGHTRRVVVRLIVFGVLITWAFGAFLAAPLLGMSRGAFLPQIPGLSSRAGATPRGRGPPGKRAAAATTTPPPDPTGHCHRRPGQAAADTLER